MDKRPRRLAAVVIKRPAPGRNLAWWVLAGCFGVGVGLGCFLASCLAEGENAQLSAYLDSCFALVETGGTVPVPLYSALWETFRWPAAAALVGTTLLGVAAVPGLLLARGLLLSYAVSVFVRLFGWHGLLLAAAIFAIPALCSVTALFVIGADVLAHHGREGRIGRRRLLLHGAALALLLTAGGLMQHRLSPLLLRWAVGL